MDNKEWRKEYLFHNYDTRNIAMEFWKAELPRVFQAKRFLVEQVVPFLVEKGHVCESVRLDGSEWGVPKGYLETKHYNYTLVREEGIDTILMRSSTSITAFILFHIKPEDNFGMGANMRFNYPHPYETEKLGDTPYALAIVSSSGEFSDGKDDVQREKALIAAISHLKKTWKDGRGKWRNEMIWNDHAVKRDKSVKLECLYHDDMEFHELPTGGYSYTMFQLSCLHIYMAGKQYG